MAIHNFRDVYEAQDALKATELDKASAVFTKGGDGGYSPWMESRINKIEVRLDGIDKRFDSVDKRFDSVDKRFDRIETEMSSLRYWLLGSVVTILVGVAAIVISFGSYQATWFQKSLDRNWEQSQKALDKIDATMLRVERMDAEQQSQQK